MYRVNRWLFAAFLWFVASSVAGIFAQSVAALFLKDGGKALLWMHPAIYLTGALCALVYVMTRIPIAVSMLLSLVISYATLIGSKILVENFLFPRSAARFDMIVFAAIVFVVFLFLFMPLNTLTRRFRRYYDLLDRETSFPDSEKYLAWLRSETTGSPKLLEPALAVRLLTNFAFFMLALMFVAIAMKPAAAGVLTVYTLTYAGGALGVYMIYYQMTSILKWKNLGYRTEETMVKNWNVIILLMFIPLVVVPLVVPWQYSIFKTQAISDFFNTQFAKLSVSFLQGTREMNNNQVEEQETVQWTPEEEARAKQNQKQFWMTVTIVGIAVASVLAVYIALGIFGYLLLKKYKYAKKPGWVQFLINRYFRLKAFFDIMSGLFRPFVELIARMLGLRRPEVEEEAEKIEKQLYTYFESIKQLPQEKQEEIRTIIREFVRFIQTATRAVTPYYFFFGPMEYTEKVIDLRPTLAIDLRKVVGVFNESRYSLHLLTDDVRNDYMKTVDSLIVTLERSSQ